jgi:hemoglobin
MTDEPRATPYDLLGEESVQRIATRFYDHIDDREPGLARLHTVDEHGHVTPDVRERFTRFLMEWLGGPPVYTPVDGHPRLRMRHAKLAIDGATRDAWLRCMERALDDAGVAGELRGRLDQRFVEVADSLRNVE